jgi:hypothetical protein
MSVYKVRQSSLGSRTRHLLDDDELRAPFAMSREWPARADWWTALILYVALMRCMTDRPLAQVRMRVVSRPYLNDSTAGCHQIMEGPNPNPPRVWPYE